MHIIGKGTHSMQDILRIPALLVLQSLGLNALTSDKSYGIYW